MKDRSIRKTILKDWLNYGDTYQELADRYGVSKFVVSQSIQSYLKKIKDEAKAKEKYQCNVISNDYSITVINSCRDRYSNNAK